jgi:hypothetical protein
VRSYDIDRFVVCGDCGELRGPWGRYDGGAGPGAGDGAVNGGAGAGPGAVTVTVTPADLEQLRDRLGCFASLSNPDLGRWMVETGGAAADAADPSRPDTTAGVRWTATDAFRLGRLSAGSADGAATFGIPVRTFTLAWQMCDRRNAAAATFTVGGGDHGVLRVGGAEVPFDAGLSGYPDVEGYLTGKGRATGTTVTLAAEDLFAVIHGANLRPPWLDADQQESFVLHVDAGAGRLRTVASWDGHADTSAAVACTASADTPGRGQPRLPLRPGLRRR